MNRAILSLLVVSCFLCACDKFSSNNSKKEDPAKSVQASVPAVPKEPVSAISGALVARVNGWSIGADDFKNYLNTVKPLMEQEGVDVNAADFKGNFLKSLVDDQIFAQIAIERGMDKTPEFSREMRDQRNALLASRLKAEIAKNSTVSDKEVQDLYNQYRDQVSKVEERKVRELAVASEFDAKDIMMKLLQGEDFAALAKSHSVLDSKDKGGDLGFITYDEKIKFNKFWTMVFSTEKGAVSPYFKGDDGKYYIVKIDDIKKGEAPPLAEIKTKLNENLRRANIIKELNRLSNDFKTRAKVEIKEDLVK